MIFSEVINPMKKVFLIISISLLAIVLVVAGILLAHSFRKQSKMPETPFVSINGRVLEHSVEKTQMLPGIAKLSIQANAQTIRIRNIRGNDTPHMTIVYRNDSGKDMEFIPEKGIFSGGDTTVAFIDSIEAVVPPGIEINIRQRDSHIYLDGISGGSVFINSDFLNLFCSRMNGVKAFSVLTANGTLTLASSKIEKMEISACCGELSINGIESEFANLQLKSMNSLVLDSTFEDLKTSVDSGYLQIENTGIRYLNNISDGNILWLISNEIGKTDLSLKEASINLKGNQMKKISADARKTIIRTDGYIPQEVINGKDNTVVYTPDKEEPSEE